MGSPTWSGKVFTTKGARDENEDAAAVLPRGIIVCDGMGGHEAGAEASGVLVRKFREGAPIEDFAREAASWVGAIPHDGSKPPGTTCSVACYHEGKLVGIHVGDSALFLLPQDPSRPMKRLTPSDSLGETILKNSPDAVGGAYRWRHVLNRCVIGGSATDWHVCRELAHTPGDWIVGVTDGVTGAYDLPGRPELDTAWLEQDLRAVLAGTLDGQDMVEAAGAADRGKDNATLAFWRTSRPRTPRKK